VALSGRSAGPVDSVGYAADWLAGIDVAVLTAGWLGALVAVAPLEALGAAASLGVFAVESLVELFVASL
jgi:hypothetical protein